MRICELHRQTDGHFLRQLKAIAKNAWLEGARASRFLKTYADICMRKGVSWTNVEVIPTWSLAGSNRLYSEACSVDQFRLHQCFQYLILSNQFVRIDGMRVKVQSGTAVSESAELVDVDEGRKRVLLIAASILAARKLAQQKYSRSFRRQLTNLALLLTSLLGCAGVAEPGIGFAKYCARCRGGESSLMIGDFQNLETRNSPNPIAIRSSGIAIAMSRT